MFKHSVPPPKKTQCPSITKLNRLMLFREIIAIYSELSYKTKNTLCEQNAEIVIVKAGGTYHSHWALKG
jgi:hypothetical protein